MKYVDFEFSKIMHEHVDLVCATTYEDCWEETKEYWLRHSEADYALMKADMLESKEDTFVAYSVTAEARSFLSLGLMPTDFQWIDLFLEWRMLTNHCDKYCYGWQLVDGREVFVTKPKPKWQRTKEDDEKGFKPTHSLAECTYKLLGVVRDTAHKNKMRDLIISDPIEFTEEEAEAIQNYCTEDVKFLQEILAAMDAAYKELLGDDFDLEKLRKEQKLRGYYSALTAIRESKGYPINVEAAKNFSASVQSIIETCQRDINRQFPVMKPFKWSKKDQRYTWDKKKTLEWVKGYCEENDITDRWKLTDGGKSGKKELSLALDAFERFFNYQHDYPEGNFGAQIVRFLKLKQSMNGFVPSKGKKNFWDYVGPDNMVRPYMNIYGAQSSRSQPGSTGFIMLKPAWMRTLVSPPPGYAICSIDYGSEEFFISALLSRDEAMIQAYLSGDVYLAFAKDAGMVPPDGTKESYKFERNLCKATVLGISYLMSQFGLAIKLTADTGKKYTEEEAQEFIDLFNDTYHVFSDWLEDQMDQYQTLGRVELPCGWMMFGDNPNHRSSANCPIQGMGASIMREADKRTHEAGVYAPITLHDALYIMFPIDQMWQVDKFKEAMIEGFAHYFPEDQKHLARQVRLDPFIWGPDMPAPTYETKIDKKGNEYQEKIYSSITTPGGWSVDVADIYIDERSENEYNKYSRYFEYTEDQEL